MSAAIQAAEVLAVERTAEGLTMADLSLTYALSNAIGDACAPRPTIYEMCDWVDRQETIGRASLFTVASLNGGTLDPGRVRDLATARKLFDFLARCIEHEEEIITMFRVKKHNERRNG